MAGPILYNTQFPDLDWLNRQIRHGFENNKGKGWPTVIMHTQSREAYRPDIKGPLSIFMNLKGESYCQTGPHPVLLDDAHYFISNSEQHYSLEIEKGTDTETFNIHIGQDMLGELYTSHIQPHSTQLEHPQTDVQSEPHFFDRLYALSPEMKALVLQLKVGMQNEAAQLRKEELLADLMSQLLQQQRNVYAIAAKLPPVKLSTRMELYKRLSMAHDYIHTHYRQEPELDEIAGAACLSRYHFLRLFKEVYGITPHQYITQLRIASAQKLLKSSRLSIESIAEVMGFEHASSFCRAFLKLTGHSPQQYRQLCS
jgi:AraC family transcriptional regulator